ncbi:MAG: alpha/beta hydrolase family protein [Devosia sp.]
MQIKPRLVTACLLGLISLPALAAPQALTLPRPDGSLIHYTLDRPNGEPEGLLLLSQGSGCLQGATNSSLATVRGAFNTYTTLIVEKIGITPSDATIDGATDCPEAFVRGYTLSQRVDDYRLVLQHVQQETGLGPDNLVLFGGSEGGLAVAKLGSLVQPTATILLSSATGDSFGEMVRSTVPPEGHATIDAGFAAARAHPDSSELFAGSTYRFWADIVDVKTLDLMLASSSPFLIIQGGLDSSNPVAAARATVDAFAQQGRCDLTYWEFPTLDHAMRRPDGSSSLEAVAAMAVQWARTPAPAC